MQACFWAFHSVLLIYVSVFMLIKLFGLLQLCNIVWNQDMKWLWLCCVFFSRFFAYWDFHVPYNVVIVFFFFFWKMCLEFGKGLHWICRSLWLVWNFNNIDSSNSLTQDIFWFICVFFSFFYQSFIVFSVQIFYQFD